MPDEVRTRRSRNERPLAINVSSITALASVVSTHDEWSSLTLIILQLVQYNTCGYSELGD